MNDDLKSAKATQGKPDGSWNPVIMSVVVYPGIGQWMQRRHNSGLLYGVTFTLMAVLFACMLYNYLNKFIPIIHQALRGELEQGVTIPPLNYIMKPFAVVLFIYLANVYDVLRGRSQVIKELAQK